MAFRRPYTQREMDYIRDHWQTSTAGEIARELGRSTSGIYKKINDMRLRQGPSRKAPPPMESGVEKAHPMEGGEGAGVAPFHRGPMSDAERLCGLRDLIWRSMLDASPQDVARLAPEYRKTIADIGRAWRDGADGGEKDGDGGLADVLSLVCAT